MPLQKVIHNYLLGVWLYVTLSLPFFIHFSQSYRHISIFAVLQLVLGWSALSLPMTKSFRKWCVRARAEIGKQQRVKNRRYFLEHWSTANYVQECTLSLRFLFHERCAITARHTYTYRNVVSWHIFYFAFKFNFFSTRYSSEPKLCALRVICFPQFHFAILCKALMWLEQKMLSICFGFFKLNFSCTYFQTDYGRMLCALCMDAAHTARVFALCSYNYYVVYDTWL